MTNNGYRLQSGKYVIDGPNTKNIHGKPYRCAECGKPRLKGTQLCESCKKAYKNQ